MSKNTKSSNHRPSSVVDVSKDRDHPNGFDEFDIANSDADWFFEMDQNFRLLSISSTHQEITGIAHDEIVGKNPWEVHQSYVGPRKQEDQNSSHELIVSHLNWRDFTFTFTYQDDDGQRRELKNTAKAVLDEKGSFRGYRGYGQDVTSRASSEAQLNSVLEAIPDAVITIDEQGIINTFSSTAELIFGFTRSEVVGQNVGILMPEYHEKIHDEYIKQYLKTGHSKVMGVGRELEARRKDGSIFPIGLTLDEMQVDGHSIFTGVIHDLTELRKAQDHGARVGKILDQSLNEIYLFDAESLNFVQVNYGARKNTGYSNLELLELTPVDLKPDFTTKKFSKLIAPLRDATQELLVFKTNHKRKDGTIYPAEVHLQLMHNERPPLFLAVIRDISESERREAQLRQSQKMDAIGQLTGGIAHDFNNLLTIIVGNIELLSDTLSDEYQRNLLDDASTAAENAAQLTKQLLAFARQQPLKPQVIQLNELIESMVDMLARTLGEGIRLQTELNPNLSLTLADPVQVRNVVLNLAINARDAMPSGGDLTIITSHADIDEEIDFHHSEVRSGHFVTLGVRDSGSGMSSDIIERAQDPFFTTKETGTGLGLSMVHGFAKQSGGFVSIESEVNIGTIVCLHLPISDDCIEA